MKTVWAVLAGLAVAAAVLGGATLLIWKVLTDWAGWIEMHPAAVGAVATGGSAVVVLLAAALAFWGARLQGQSALEAARVQIEHSFEMEAITAIDKKLGVASVLIAEINLIIAKMRAIRRSGATYNAVDIDTLIFFTPIYDKFMIDIPSLGGGVTNLSVNFYGIINSYNENQRRVFLRLKESGQRADIFTGKNLQNAIKSLEMPHQMAEKLSHDLSQMITDLGGSPPVGPNPAPQSPDQDPGPAAT